MRTWDLPTLAREPSSPQVLTSTAEARAITLFLPAGRDLSEHEVHERAWVLVVEGEVEVTTPEGGRLTGGAGFLAEFEPTERHAVAALQDTRLLIVLAPWPGEGHPSARAGS